MKRWLRLAWALLIVIGVGYWAVVVNALVFHYGSTSIAVLNLLVWVGMFLESLRSFVIALARFTGVDIDRPPPPK